jgi:hypothetical protein
LASHASVGGEIIDTHHHFWDRPDHRYLLDELLADLANGHNIDATVFLECRSMRSARMRSLVGAFGCSLSGSGRHDTVPVHR